MIHLPGRRYLVTGYGSFGGTSLVKMALKKVQQELKTAYQNPGALLALYCEVDENGDNRPFHVTMFGLGRVGEQSQFHSNIMQWNHLKERADLNENLDDHLSVLAWKVPSRLEVHTLQNSRHARSQTTYTLPKLFEDIEALQNKPSSANLRKVLKSLLNSDSLPSRVILIVDPVKKLETFERLKNFELLKDDRIHVLSVARRENFDAWGDSGKTTAALKSAGFSEWYVPSMDDDTMRNRISEAVKFSNNESQNDRDLILKSFMYTGRGVVGNILETLRDPKNVLHSESGAKIDTEKLKNDPKTKCHAWLQDVLEKNWLDILSDDFAGQQEEQKRDRARQAIYRLVDWIGERHDPFTEQDILEAAEKAAVTISNDKKVRGRTVKRLLYVLEKTGYLKKSDDWEYQECLNNNNQPIPLAIKIPKDFTASQSKEAEVSQLLKPKATTFDQSSQSAKPQSESDHVSKIQEVSTMSSSSITAFISYSHKDKRLREKFETHLAALQHQGILKTWHDGKILAGDEIDESIMEQLEASPIVFLLVSSDFLASKYCYSIEMKKAIERHEKKEACVIPIILRECDWEKTPFQKLKALPEDGKPIASKHWKTQDAAFKNVARGVRTLLERFVSQSPAP